MQEIQANLEIFLGRGAMLGYHALRTVYDTNDPWFFTQQLQCEMKKEFLDHLIQLRGENISEASSS